MSMWPFVKMMGCRVAAALLDRARFYRVFVLQQVRITSTSPSVILKKKPNI